MMALAKSHARTEASLKSPQRRGGIPWLWIGLAVSLPLHAILLAVLARIDSGIGASEGNGVGNSPVTIALHEPTDFEPLEGDSASDDTTTPEVSQGASSGSGSAADAFGLPEAVGNSGGDAIAAAQGPAGGMSAVGGGGGDGGFGSGAGSGTKFFGVAGRGKRIGYVLDKSGSMGTDRRLFIAMNELRSSIAALPDFASVCVALFDDGVTTMDPENGFVKCHASDLAELRKWLSQIGPGGGTNPIPAFELLFSRRERPDAVYFMSDGEIPSDAADEILRLNRRGPNSVIHCIAFGQAAATAPLRRIASETGGTFSVAHGAVD